MRHGVVAHSPYILHFPPILEVCLAVAPGLALGIVNILLSPDLGSVQLIPSTGARLAQLGIMSVVNANVKGAESLTLSGTLRGHQGWVTSVVTCANFPDRLISASRDKTTLIWKLTPGQDVSGYEAKRLYGHSHFVSDVSMSSDSNYALTSSWDQTLRLWDLKTGQTSRRFVGHTNDVLSVSFSNDNRQIVSGGRDKSVRLWNTLGHCKWNMIEDGHTDWVSCVKFSPSPNQVHPLVVSTGWDKNVKLWNLGNCRSKATMSGHSNSIFCMAISPDGSLCCTGAKDNTVVLWDLQDCAKLCTLNLPGEVNDVKFSPNRYWLCAACSNGSICIYDLESKNMLDEAKPEFISPTGSTPAQALCMCWSGDGMTLYTGYSDGNILIWKLKPSGSSY